MIVFDKILEEFILAHNKHTDLSNSKIAYPAHMLKDIPFIKSKISMRMHNTLAAINNEGSMTMSQIAEIIALDKSNTTKYVAKLIDSDYVVRRHDSEDKRKVYVELTEKARKLLDENKRVIENNLKNQLKKNVSEDELSKVIECYDYICGILERFD